MLQELKAKEKKKKKIRYAVTPKNSIFGDHVCNDTQKHTL